MKRRDREPTVLDGVEQRLSAFARLGGAPGTETAARLLERLGRPQDRLKFVHVAGTNGKGSTAAMIAAGLTAAGCRTGLFTSPSVEKLTERVCVDGEPAADEVFAAAMERVFAAAEGLPAAPARFDLLTAAAMLVFAESGCRIAVLEVGLGGRLDATNVIPSAEVSVITSISLDHTALLGTTAAEIAAEKCGIFKPGCPVVSAPGQTEEAAAVIRRRAAETGCELTVPDLAALEPGPAGPDGTAFRYRGRAYRVGMAGRHFVENAVTALEAMGVLARRGWPLTDGDLAAGVAVPPLPGRFQTVFRSPRVILDGAHNPDAVRRLCAAVRDLFPGRRVVTVMGMCGDKDWRTCVPMAAAMSEVFLACEPRSDRAVAAEEIARAAEGHAGRVCISKRPGTALTFAVRFAGEDGIVLCCGSFAGLADVRRGLARYGPYLAYYAKI